MKRNRSWHENTRRAKVHRKTCLRRFAISTGLFYCMTQTVGMVPSRNKHSKREGDMATSSDETKRIKQRFAVDLKAEISLAGQETQEHQCRITDLSATGARLHFGATSSLTQGMPVTIKIFIPKTIMSIPNSGEIMWVKKAFKECRVGIKFTEFLSETMLDQLIKND